MVLPAPVWPTMAAVSPGSMVKLRRGEPSRVLGFCRALLGWTGEDTCRSMNLFAARCTGIVGEPNMVEFYAAGAFRLLRNRRSRDVGWRIQQLEYALAGGHRRLQNVVFFAEILNRAEKSLCILNEGNEDAERHGCRNRSANAICGE